MKKSIIIYNPNSGKNSKEKTLPKLKEVLNDYNYEVEIIETKKKGHATTLVKEVPYVDLLISIGGDGTFNEAMTGNFARKKKINPMSSSIRNN